MDPPSNLMRVDGKRAIGIGVATGAKDDVVAVGDAVAEHLKEMEQLFPIGMELKTIYPENQIANEANNGFILNLIESLLIVIVIIFLVMGSRAGMLGGQFAAFLGRWYVADYADLGCRAEPYVPLPLSSLRWVCWWITRLW